MAMSQNTTSNQLSKFYAIQKKEMKWIIDRKFDHYSDKDFFKKQKELYRLPVKFKFILSGGVEGQA